MAQLLVALPSFTLMNTWTCGFSQSTRLTMPRNATDLLSSNFAATAWCAIAGCAASRATPTASKPETPCFIAIPPGIKTTRQPFARACERPRELRLGNPPPGLATCSTADVAGRSRRSIVVPFVREVYRSRSSDRRRLEALYGLVARKPTCFRSSVSLGSSLFPSGNPPAERMNARTSAY